MAKQVERGELMLLFLSYYEKVYGIEYAGDLNRLSTEQLFKDIEKLQDMLN